MSTIADAQDNMSDTGTIAANIPVDQDDRLILWDNLLATILGKLAELADWCDRVGYKRGFLKHRAVVTDKVTIVDHKDSITFFDPNSFCTHHRPPSSGPSSKRSGRPHR